MAVISPQSRRMRATYDDQLWLARAVEAEGEPRDLIAQTLVNRWVTLADRGSADSLADTVRAYSQPVNPRWFPDGDLFRAALNAAAPADRARLLARAERRRDELSRVTLFSSETREAVRRAFEGPITIPAGALHFAPETADRNARFKLLVQGPNAIYGLREDDRPRRYWVDQDLVRQAMAAATKRSPLPSLFVAVFAAFGVLELLKRKPARRVT